MLECQQQQQKKADHKTSHPGYCRKNSRIKCNQIDPNCDNINNCAQNSLGGKAAGGVWRKCVRGRTAMFFIGTRCQQANADRCLLVLWFLEEKVQGGQNPPNQRDALTLL